MKIAIPRFGEEVAPCFEYSGTIAIFTVEAGRVCDQLDFPLTSKDPLDRVRLLRDQRVDALICGGVDARFEQLVRASGIEVVSWVAGEADAILEQFIRGELVPGSGRLGSQPEVKATSEE